MVRGFRERLFGKEAVPRVFQTFNSLLGSMVRKPNATLLGPSKQLVGEYPEVGFDRLYQYYHHWDQVKTAIDVMHQKFRGSGVSIKSNNEYFNKLVERWWDITNAEKKLSQYIFSLLITGNAIMELQYTPDGRLGNVEQIPLQTIYRIYRDQYGNELKLVQNVDGVFKELDPKYFIHQTINNPDRHAFGKSMFNTLASPKPLIGMVDPLSGEPINPSRQMVPLLDAMAEIQNAEIEIKKKMAKPRLIVSANGMPREQMAEYEREMSDANTDKYIWIMDRPITSAELQIQANGKFDDYQKNLNDHISIGLLFAFDLIKNPSGFSYSGGQLGLDVLDQTMMDFQSETLEMLKDKLLKALAESWGFIDFDAMEVEMKFIPTMKRLTMDDINGLDKEAVSKKEIRELYKQQNIPLDDALWEEEQNELKQDKQDQKNIQMQGAITGVQQDPDNNPSKSKDPASAFKTPPPFDNGDDKPQNGSGSVKAPTVKPQSPPQDKDRPKPTPDKGSRPKGESLVHDIIKQIANENNMDAKAKIEVIKALERITLPSMAGNMNASTDLFVSQGIDDMQEKPSITDPEIRSEYGLDKDDSETPPTDPSKIARGGDKPNLAPSDNSNGRFTNTDGDGIPQIPTVSLEEYKKHLNANNGNAQVGTDTNDGIDSDSDGSYKDPYDLNNTLERTPEDPRTMDPHPRPNQEPMVKKPVQMSGGSDALPDNTKKQILGNNDNDEQPFVPSEGDKRDKDPKKRKQKEDSQNITEAVNPNSPFVKPKKDIKIGEDPMTTGIIEEDEEEVQKQQARLDDHPLQNPSANKGNIDGINPSRTSNKTNQEEPETLANNDDDTIHEPVPPFDNTSDMLGDSSQVRLQRTEQTGIQQDQLKPNNGVFDNSGINTKPEFKQVSQDDYMKRVQTGEDPLEQRGEPLEDGMIMKPEDVRQNDGLQESPNTPDGTTAFDQDPNTMNDPTDSGIDEEEVDPNILHVDPETGRLVTDLTDEQGNNVPDLRFDQTPTSDEEQPEVELEYEIVTKEEYEQHLDASKSGQVDALKQQNNMTGATGMPNSSQGFLDEDPLDPIEKDENGKPKPLVGASNQLEGEFPEEVPATGSDASKSVDINEDNQSGSAPTKPKEKPSKDKTNPRNKPTGKKGGEEPKSDEEPKPKSKKKQKKEDKKKKSEPKDELDTEDLPDVSGDVDNIIKREHELMDLGVPEDEIHDILLDEFKEKGKDEGNSI